MTGRSRPYTIWRVNYFNDEEKQTLHNQKIKNIFKPSLTNTPHEEWTYITDICKYTGKQILGPRERKQMINYPELKKLSQKAIT